MNYIMSGCETFSNKIKYKNKLQVLATDLLEDYTDQLKFHGSFCIMHDTINLALLPFICGWKQAPLNNCECIKGPN